jgi:hypothetical protein
MASFTKNATKRTPFGKNAYLRSTQDVKFESYTLAASTVPTITIDTNAGKTIQPGTVMAKCTSGAESGKIGPFQTGATDGRQTVANIVGVLDTFLPWQLDNRDVEVAVAYEATVVGAWLFEAASGTAYQAAQTATKAALATGGGANSAILVR